MVKTSAPTPAPGTACRTQHAVLDPADQRDAARERDAAELLRAVAGGDDEAACRLGGAARR